MLWPNLIILLRLHSRNGFAVDMNNGQFKWVRSRQGTMVDISHQMKASFYQCDDFTKILHSKSIWSHGAFWCIIRFYGWTAMYQLLKRRKRTHIHTQGEKQKGHTCSSRLTQTHIHVQHSPKLADDLLAMTRLLLFLRLLSVFVWRQSLWPTSMNKIWLWSTIVSADWYPVIQWFVRVQRAHV